MFDSFLVRAALGALGVALAAAPLGCFVVWRRMAYFSDATAHAALLGVALSLALSISVFVGALLVALVMALMIGGLRSGGPSADTLLGVLAHSALALGLVTVSFLPNVRVDLLALSVRRHSGRGQNRPSGDLDWGGGGHWPFGLALASAFDSHAEPRACRL